MLLRCVHMLESAIRSWQVYTSHNGIWLDNPGTNQESLILAKAEEKGDFAYFFMEVVKLLRMFMNVSLGQLN